MKRRLLASLMALSLVVSMIPMNAFAEGTENENAGGTAVDCTHVSVEPVEKVEATCVDTGVEAHYKCPDCGKLFREATATNEVTEADLVIETTNDHLWGEYVSNDDATCEEDGTKTAQCTREGCEAEDTQIDEDSAACTYPEEAWDYSKTKHWAICSVCGTKSVEEDHEYEFGKDECSVCGHLREHEHALKKVDAVEATCTSDGNIEYYICINEECGIWFEDEDAAVVIEDEASVVEAKLGHDYIHTSNKDATCVKDGTKVITCSRCEYRAVTQDKESKLGHDFVYTSNDDATCTADGTKTGVCSREGCAVTETVSDEGSALGHEFLDKNYVSNENATCTADGTETATCDRCTETTTRTAKGTQLTHDMSEATCDAPKTCKHGCGYTEGEALGHTYGEYVSDNNATCTEDGTQTRTCTRENCGAKDTVVEEGTAAHKHAAEWTMGAKNHWQECSVCGDKGNLAAHEFDGDKCSVCGYIRDHVHRLTLVEAVEATCTEKGNTAYYTCSGCEDWFEDAEGTVIIADKKSVVIAEIGHEFTVYTLDDNATCTEDGTKTAVCDRTGCTETDTIVVENTMLGHSFTNYVSDENASCTEKGTKTAKCDRCTETNTVVDEESIAEHKFGDWIVEKAPTCTETGTRKRICTVCEKEEITSVEAAGHTWDTKTTMDKAPTCTENGIESIHCTVCDVTKDAKEIEALGHEFGDYVSDNNATCTADGTKTAECYYCTAKDTVKEEGTKLEHTYSSTWSKGEGEHWHECTGCGAKKDFQIHTFIGDVCRECGYEREHVHQLSLEAAVAADCTEAGNTAYYTCSGCEEWFDDAEGTLKIEDKATVTIPALGHDMTEATCEKAAVCNRENCDYTEGQALGHSFTNYVSDNNAKCTKDATETAICDRCDKPDTRLIPGTALGHDYNDDKICVNCKEEKPSAQIEFLETSREVTYDGKAYALSENVVEAYDATGEITFKYYVDAECETPTFNGKSNEGKPASATGVYYVKAVVAEDETYVETETEDTYRITIKPRRVEGFAAANQNTTIKLTWDKSSEATGYIVYRRLYGTSSSEYKAIKTITNNKTLSYTDGNISQGKRYIYSIAAYKDAKDGTRVIGNKLSAATEIVRIKIKGIENKNGSVKLTWSQIPGAAGYKIYRKASGMDDYGYLKNVKSGTTTTYTDKYAKSLKNGKVSYYYVEVYFEDESAGVVKSNTKKHYYLKRPAVASVTAGSKAFTVKWDKNSSATGYEIMYSTSSSFDNDDTDVIVISGKNIVSEKITGLKKNKKYYVKVRTYKSSGSTTYYSAWSAYKTVKTK